MKALIVDDEKHVRSAIKLLVCWEAVNITEIYEAENVDEAQQIVMAQKPEIIFTDIKMPQKDGIDFMKWLKETSSLSKIIVVSGYNDFSYVRNSMQYGGLDYILKPIDAEQLNDAVKKAVDTWNEEEQQRLKNKFNEIKLNVMTPLYWDNIFSGIIKSPVTYYDKVEEISKEFKINNKMVKCQIAVLSFETIDISKIEGFKHQSDLFFFAIKNICTEILESYGNCLAFKNINSDNEVVLFFWAAFENVETILNKINNGLFKVLKVYSDFGVSEIKQFPDDSSLCYGEALKALRRRNISPLSKKAYLSSNRIHKFDSQFPASKISNHFSNYEDKIKLAVQGNNKNQIQSNIGQWINFIQAQKVITLEDIQFELEQYEITLSKWIKEFFSNENLVSESFSYHIMLSKIINQNGFLSPDALQEEVLNQLNKLCDILSDYHKKDSKVIYEIARYLENNYKENISLKDISEIFYLSREYISRKFKQEIGVNISDYLIKIRIENAKLLLQNPDMKIREISQIVGYEDDKYFHKVFKKVEGISPNEYRFQLKIY